MDMSTKVFLTAMATVWGLLGCALLLLLGGVMIANAMIATSTADTVLAGVVGIGLFTGAAATALEAAESIIEVITE